MTNLLTTTANRRCGFSRMQARKYVQKPYNSAPFFYQHTMPSVLIAEDSEKIRKVILFGLRELNFKSDVAATAAEAEFKLRTNTYDLIIMDRMFEDESLDGLDIIKSIRALQVLTPVLMLTARSSLMERVSGLSDGADDYLTKPFHLPELMARAQALLRRKQGNAHAFSEVLAVGSLRLDRSNYTAELGNKPIVLNRKEFQLLNYLLENADRVVSRAEILEKIWGETNTSVMSNTVDVHIRRIRKKLGDFSTCVSTIYCAGYILRKNNLRALKSK